MDSAGLGPATKEVGKTIRHFEAKVVIWGVGKFVPEGMNQNGFIAPKDQEHNIQIRRKTGEENTRRKKEIKGNPFHSIKARKKWWGGGNKEKS